MMSILTSASPLCFLLLSTHIFLTFHLPSPSPYLTIHHREIDVEEKESMQELSTLRYSNQSIADTHSISIQDHWIPARTSHSLQGHQVEVLVDAPLSTSLTLNASHDRLDSSVEGIELRESQDLVDPYAKQSEVENTVHSYPTTQEPLYSSQSRDQIVAASLDTTKSFLSSSLSKMMDEGVSHPGLGPHLAIDQTFLKDWAKIPQQSGTLQAHVLSNKGG